MMSMASIYSFVFVILSTCLSVLCENDNKENTVLLNLIQVEGIKTPSKSYLNVDYGFPASWPEGWSQLTNEGKRTQYEIGKWLRTKYPRLINTYYEDDVYVLSSDVNSAIMSAETLLAGMYPPFGTQIWASIDWQPIPVHTIPKDRDNLIALTAFCNKYNLEMNTKQFTEKIRSIDEMYHGLYAYLSQQVEETVNSMKKVAELYENLLIQEKLNFTTPEWAQDVMPMMEEVYYSIHLSMPTYFESMRILRAGPLILNIWGHILEKYNKLKTGFELDDDVPSVRIYSVHIDTMMSLTNALGLYNQIKPSFSSTFLWELVSKSDDEFFIKISYKNSDMDEAYELNLPECGNHCTVDAVTSLFAEFTPDKLDCSNPSENEKANIFELFNLNRIELTVWILVALIVVVLICIYCIKTRRIIYRRLK